MNLNIDSSSLIPRSMRVDPPKGDGTKLRLRVVVNPVKTSIPGVTGRVAHGEQIVDVWKADMPQILALVEDDMEAVKRAEGMHQRKRLRFLKEMREDKTVDLPENEADWPEYIRKAASQYVGSNAMGELYTLIERGMKPLASVEILEEIPPAESKDRQMLRAVAADVAEAAGAFGRSEDASLKAEVAELKEQVQQLLKRGNKQR